MVERERERERILREEIGDSVMETRELKEKGGITREVKSSCELFPEVLIPEEGNGARMDVNFGLNCGCELWRRIKTGSSDEGSRQKEIPREGEESVKI